MKLTNEVEDDLNFYGQGKKLEQLKAEAVELLRPVWDARPGSMGEHMIFYVQALWFFVNPDKFFEM